MQNPHNWWLRQICCGTLQGYVVFPTCSLDESGVLVADVPGRTDFDLVASEDDVEARLGWRPTTVVSPGTPGTPGAPARSGACLSRPCRVGRGQSGKAAAELWVRSSCSRSWHRSLPRASPRTREVPTAGHGPATSGSLSGVV